MRKREYLVVVMTFLCISILLNLFETKAYADEDDTICNGIYIDSVNIGGMNSSQATKAVADYVGGLKNKTLAIQIDNNLVTATLAELGYECVKNNYVEEAVNLGKQGNLVKRYKELKDVEHERLIFNLQFTVDKKKIQALVESKCEAFNQKAVEATITRKDGAFIVTDHKVGRKVQVDETVGKIESAILNEWDKKDIVLDAVMIDDVPKCTKEALEKCKDLLGEFTTSFQTSNANRSSNIANATKLLNGSVIAPDEVFSVGKSISPITAENGYEIGGAYQNGKLVDSVGGGVCQVATTIYNAALYSELEIKERSNHSMTVSYVDIGRDAAISGDYKDLKIKNNTDAPVYIESYVKGGQVTFRIYGHETRSKDRKIEFASQILQTIKPPGQPKYDKDSTKPASFSETTQSAHTGYKAKLWKIVYENGVKKSKEQVNNSSYRAEPEHITVGTQTETSFYERKNDRDLEEKEQTRDTQDRSQNRIFEIEDKIGSIVDDWTDGSY